MSSFTDKQLRVTLILAGNFPGTDSNTLVLTGLRTIAVIQEVAGLATNADVRIFGMLPDDMNALTIAFFNPGGGVLNQVLIVEANDGDGWVQVFSGTMLEAQPDYRAAPYAFFRMQAAVGYFAQISPVPPLSYPAAVSVAAVVEKLAGQMGFAFENNGVTTQLAAGAYFPGTAFDQLRSVCQAANVDFYFVGKVLAICPASIARKNVPTVILNPGSGLIGYPVIERNGITVECVYNPGIVGGGQVQVEGSDIPAANGTWMPYALTHTLESMSPGGAWLSSLQCIKFGMGTS